MCEKVNTLMKFNGKLQTKSGFNDFAFNDIKNGF